MFIVGKILYSVALINMVTFYDFIERPKRIELGVSVGPTCRFNSFPFTQSFTLTEMVPFHVQKTQNCTLSYSSKEKQQENKRAVPPYFFKVSIMTLAFHL